MVMLFFSGLDPAGERLDASFGGPDLEGGLDALAHMINKGWQLIYVEMVERGKPPVVLPPALFDGALFTGPMEKLRQEWKQVLQQDEFTDQKEEWLNQHLALLSDQVKELRDLSRVGTKQYYTLKKEHQQEKAGLSYLYYEPGRWAQLLIKHCGEITELRNTQKARRTNLMGQHKQQEEALRERIESEKRRLGIMD